VMCTSIVPIQNKSHKIATVYDRPGDDPVRAYPEARLGRTRTGRESSTLRFQALGPLVVLRGDEPVAITGINQLAALGYLLLHANQVVATSELLQALWGDSPPPTARKILQNAISSLRRALADPRDPNGTPLLITQAPGYLLRIPAADLDLGSFRELAQVGQFALTAGRWDEAEQHLRDALALWRGPVLADLAEAGFDWPELTALRNARIAALENRMEAALAAGRHLEIIDELESLVHSGPLRERLSRQLMLALYRSGRQVDALQLYQRMRSVLVNELGLDPSPELRELERAILDHDPALHPSGDSVIRLPGRAGLVPVSATRAGPAPDRGARSGPRPAALAGGQPAAVNGRQPVPAGKKATAELRWLTAVLVRWETPFPAPALDVLEQQAAAADRMVRYQTHKYGGQSHAALGQVQVALFGATGVRADDAECALRAAIAISERSRPDFRLYVAVSSGEGLIRSAEGHPPDAICGLFLEAGLDLLRDSSVRAVRVCDATRAACGDRFNFTMVTAKGGYQLDLPGPRELCECTG
jgi:DNA-binding SARP family transcriptional activator